MNNCMFYAVAKYIFNCNPVVVRKSRMTHMWPFCKYHYLSMDRGCEYTTEPIDVLYNIFEMRKQILAGNYVIFKFEKWRPIGIVISKDVGEQLECLKSFIPLKNLGKFPPIMFKGSIKTGDK